MHVTASDMLDEKQMLAVRNRAGEEALATASAFLSVGFLRRHELTVNSNRESTVATTAPLLNLEGSQLSSLQRRCSHRRLRGFVCDAGDAAATALPESGGEPTNPRHESHPAATGYPFGVLTYGGQRGSLLIWSG